MLDSVDLEASGRAIVATECGTIRVSATIAPAEKGSSMSSVSVKMDFVDLRNAQNTLVLGRHVDNLQGLLKGTRNPVWDPGAIDGQGGQRTMAAVMAFQGANSLAQDAIVGPLTWGALIPFRS